MAKTVLIIDDDPDWVKMVSIRLQRNGYQAEVAFDSIQAVSQALSLKPDLILLDIMLPAGGGIEVLRHLKGNVNTFKIPVIALTAISDEQTIKAAVELGVSGYFVKPTDMVNLLEKIEEVLIKK